MQSKGLSRVNIIGNVENKNCLVVDDFSITGGTLVDVARALKEHGARHVYGALSHNVMTQKAVHRIEESDYEWLVSTDTLECPFMNESTKLRTISAAPMFAQAVKTIHDRAPLSSMFDHRVLKRLMDLSIVKDED